ncbi:pyridine nucleotide-disulfide oxidoreductase [Colletotrichum plurivorum]|uniref:Pyridine nucleotide-disulfide oxidoreductase n=1 Tax=Colletotrichum plurivorum TaxID=2175906 RepID=A0A8H6JLN7_9PEZI|nr:pyridine nucleotide-disulfide oxidoreductase [Colletotrichum plurivorum]
MRVLISGAGIAGPTLAYFLAKTGARVTVLDRSRDLLRQGQNVDVGHSAVAVIRKMGLMNELRRWNTTEKGTRILDDRGKTLASFPLREGSLASPTSEFEVLRGDLAWLIHGATRDAPKKNVEYLFGTTAKRVISNDDRAVKVELSDGQVREFDLLVVADGQRSALRAQCFPEEAVTMVDKDMYVVYATIPRVPGDDDWWNVFFALGSRIVTLRPDPHGTIRAMVTKMPLDENQRAAWRAAAAKGGDRAAQQELVRREFEGAGWQVGRVLDGMEAAPDYYFQAVEQVRMERWSAGRVVCLGDAAHAPSPLTGMGASLAITGAYVLAGELSGLREGEHPTRALEEFERKFRPFVEEVQKIPSMFPGSAHPATPLQRWMLHAALSTMDWVLGRVSSMPWMQRKFLNDETTEDTDFPLPKYPKLEASGL